jgi:hypothetical protein
MVVGSAFLDDGRLALRVALPDGERQGWTVDPSNHFTVQRLGEIAPHAAMAVRPDGELLAYFLSGQQAPTDTPSVFLDHTPATAGPSDTELLDACGEETAYALESLGTSPRRLDHLEIAELLYSCWCPERASQQPLVPAAVVSTIATRIHTSPDAAAKAAAPATGPGAATAKAAAPRARHPGAS